MAFNGTGTFVRIYNWVNDKVNAVPITASSFDAELDGMASGLSDCITKDGQTTITGNIPMNSHNFTGLSTGNARTDSLTLGQVQDGQFTALGLTGGAADAYTASPSPAITAYVPTMEYSAKIHATNLTTNPTLLISAISGGTIKKLDASKAEIAVEASDMLANGWYNFKRNVANDAWILLNPEKSFINLANANGYAVAATESVAGIAKLLKQITIANNATDANNDIDFSAGNFQFDDGSGMASLSALTKRLDATWAAGTNQGGLFTGSKANSTWYHCFAIYNPTSGLIDCGFDTSVTAANIPSGYTKYYLIESIKTDGSGNILAFNMNGNTMTWVARPLDISISPPVSTAKIDYTMSIPLGRQVMVNLGGNCTSSSGTQRCLFILSPLQSSITPTGTDCDASSENSINGNIAANVLSNTSSQISMIANFSSDFQIKIRTRSWSKP
jgi:hypothetical protein